MRRPDVHNVHGLPAGSERAVRRAPKHSLRVTLGVVLGIVIGLLWYARGAPGNPPTAHQSPTGGGETKAALPALPVVARPPTAQPAVGLASDRHLDKTPPRQTKGLDLVKMGWTYNCMECHRLLSSRWHYDRPMAEHQDIRLEHGNNRFCLNCHHPENRNAFVDYDGSEIAEEEVVSLCAKCHGTIHRDWKAAVHGRVNGCWNAAFGEKTRLRCIQCHDPHRPAFQPMKPLPPLEYPRRAAHPPGPQQAAARRH